MAVVQIAELTLDVDAVLKSSADLRKEIDRLKQSNRELDRSTEEGRKQLARNEAELRNLNKAYRDNQKTASALISVNKDLERAISTENKSVQELRDSRRQLIAIVNQLNGETEEEIALINQLNTAIDEQTQAIREGSSEFNASKDAIGEYSAGIQDAVGNLFGLSGGLQGAIQGVIGLTRASLAFIATPIGAILAVIAGAVLLVQNALNRSEEATNKLKRAIAPLTGIFNGILKALEPVGEFLIEGIVVGFELVTQAIEIAIDNLATALEFFGLEGAAESVRAFNEELQESAALSVQLADATAELERSQRQARLTQLEFQRDAEILRQIRDDENRSIRERIQANDELGAVLQQQLQAELRIAEQALLVANLRIQAEGETSAALDAQADALTEIADIQERITGQESEQLTNRVQLQREAADAAREAAEERIEILEKETEIFLEQNQIRQDASLAARELERRKELDILDAKIREQLISEQDAALERIRIENEFQAAKTEIQNEEIARLQEFEERKRDLINELALLREEDELARAELELQQQFEDQIRELEQLQLNEEEKTALLALLEQQRQELLANIQNEFQQQQLDQFKAALEEENQVRLAAGQEAANITRQVTSILTGLLGDSLGARLASIAIDAAIQAGLVAITTAGAQAQNLAQATAAAPPPLNVPFIATALAQNAALQASSSASISKILAGAAIQAGGAIAQSFDKGGILSGPSHAQGGIATPFGEMEGGEAVINKRSTAMFKPLLSRINQAGGGRKFQTGGITSAGITAISNQITTTTTQQQSFDFERLAGVVIAAIEAMPPQQVSVEEINTVNTRVNVIEEQATV